MLVRLYSRFAHDAIVAWIPLCCIDTKPFVIQTRAISLCNELATDQLRLMRVF
jgi:hypothetical protein